jgi:hypothetical protein
LYHLPIKEVIFILKIKKADLNYNYLQNNISILFEPWERGTLVYLALHRLMFKTKLKLGKVYTDRELTFWLLCRLIEESESLHRMPQQFGIILNPKQL